MNNIVRLFALGGLDEDGKNLYVVENNNDIFVIECGLRFPVNGDNLGIEMIVPDISYLVEHKDRVKGIFLTHGHDDVMGGLLQLLKQIPDAPIYTAPLTALMIERKLKAEGMGKINLHRIRRNAKFKVGNTNIRTFGTMQSIADGFGLAIQTSEGYVVYSSEFIVDYDTHMPSFVFDITNVTDLAKEGVLALLCESVAATREGNSAPHHRLTNTLEPIFEDSEDRILITVFNQNLYRVIEIIELANKYNRRVFLYDEGLKAMMSDMAKLGYYHIPAGLEIVPSKFNNEDERVLVLVGGTGDSIFQKVHRIANKEDSVIELRKSDTVVIASPAVTGTERLEASMENDLYKEANRVLTVDAKRSYSMHASVEDLKMMIYLMNPKYYVPVKGEYRQLIANANIALGMGYQADKIIVLANGQVATFRDGILDRKYESVKVGDVMVDGKDSLDASGMVLKDRDILSTDGVIVAGVVMNHRNKEIIGGPDIQSRGVIYLKDADYIMKEVGNILEATINTMVKEKRYDNLEARSEAREKIARYLLKETGKRPMILPAIVEINIQE